MTKDEFVTPMKELASVYKGQFALNVTDDKSVKAEIMDVWYKYLGDLDGEDFANAVTDWITHEDNAPSLRQIRNKTQTIQWKREGYSV